MSDDFPRITAPDDPDRCQRTMMPFGQCKNKARKDSKFCHAHANNLEELRKNDAAVRNYMLSKWRARTEALTSSSVIKSLREEIGILRLLIEERINSCQDTADLLLQSGPISDLVSRVEKVVLSCHKLERSLDHVLDRNTLIQFASEIISIVSETLADQPEKVDLIANRIALSAQSADSSAPKEPGTFDLGSL